MKTNKDQSKKTREGFIEAVRYIYSMISLGKGEMTVSTEFGTIFVEVCSRRPDGFWLYNHQPMDTRISQMHSVHPNTKIKYYARIRIPARDRKFDQIEKCIVSMLSSVLLYELSDGFHPIYREIVTVMSQYYQTQDKYSSFITEELPFATDITNASVFQLNTKEKRREIFDLHHHMRETYEYVESITHKVKITLINKMPLKNNKDFNYSIYITAALITLRDGSNVDKFLIDVREDSDGYDLLTIKRKSTSNQDG